MVQLEFKLTKDEVDIVSISETESEDVIVEGSSRKRKRNNEEDSERNRKDQRNDNKNNTDNDDDEIMSEIGDETEIVNEEYGEEAIKLIGELETRSIMIEKYEEIDIINGLFEKEYNMRSSKEREKEEASRIRRLFEKAFEVKTIEERDREEVIVRRLIEEAYKRSAFTV